MIGQLPLTDHHCHGVVGADIDLPEFEALLSEGGPAPEGMSRFDTPLGLAVRRHCAPVLGLEPHADPATYLRRRQELGAGQVNRLLLRAANIATLLIDTGYRADTLLGVDQMAATAGAAAHEIIRLEAVAERLAHRGVEPVEFAMDFRRALGDAIEATGAVGVKSVAAYRVGLDFDPHPPDEAGVAAAAASWLAEPAAEGFRLADPVLTRALLWAAVDLGLPIQFHVGYGDRDIRLHRCHPALLTDFIRQVPPRVPIMLLHNYPYQREAGYLAAVYPNVYLDVGLALNHVAPVRATAVLAEALELAPFGKLLFSSDAFGLAELYHLGAWTFRRALGRLLDERVGSCEWSAADADRIAAMVSSGNASRVYRIAGAAP